VLPNLIALNRRMAAPGIRFARRLLHFDHSIPSAKLRIRSGIQPHCAVGGCVTSTQFIVDTLTRHLSETKSLGEGANIRKLRDSYQSLLENERWLSGVVNPLALSTRRSR